MVKVSKQTGGTILPPGTGRQLVQRVLPQVSRVPSLKPAATRSVVRPGIDQEVALGIESVQNSGLLGRLGVGVSAGPPLVQGTNDALAALRNPEVHEFLERSPHPGGGRRKRKSRTRRKSRTKRQSKKRSKSRKRRKSKKRRTSKRKSK